ncbi:MAG: DUF2330 domain-containing protein [Myxococcaceae bacterium]|nr:DUF2330 domain-containing protein [Myxococcaceae bacterium]
MKRLFALVVGLCAPAASAWGFIVSQEPFAHRSAGAQVVILRDDDASVLTVQRDVEGPRSPFAWVLPLPGPAELRDARALHTRDLEHLHAVTAPRLDELWERDPCVEPRPSEEQTFSPVLTPAIGLGEYQLTMLESHQVEPWLRARGFLLAGLTGAPLSSRFSWVVAEVDLERARVEKDRFRLSPLQFRFHRTVVDLPLAVMVGDAPRQDVVVHLITRAGRMTAKGLPSLFAPTNVDLELAWAPQFPAVFATLLEAVWTRTPTAVVTEFSGPVLRACERCGPPLEPTLLRALGFDGSRLPPVADAGDLDPRARQQLKWRNARGEDLVVTRLRLRVAAGAPETVSFVPAPPSDPFESRFAVRHHWTKRARCGDPRWGDWSTTETRGQPRVGPWAPMSGPALPAPLPEVERALASQVAGWDIAGAKPPPGTSRRGR